MKLLFNQSALVGVEVAKVFFPNKLGALVIQENTELDVVLVKGTEDNYDLVEGISWRNRDVSTILEAIREIKPD